MYTPSIQTINNTQKHFKFDELYKKVFIVLEM